MGPTKFSTVNLEVSVWFTQGWVGRMRQKEKKVGTDHQNMSSGRYTDGGGLVGGAFIGRVKAGIIGVDALLRIAFLSKTENKKNNKVNAKIANCAGFRPIMVDQQPGNANPKPDSKGAFGR